MDSLNASLFTLNSIKCGKVYDTIGKDIVAVGKFRLLCLNKNYEALRMNVNVFY